MEKNKIDLDEAIARMSKAEDELYKACPKMADPSWWDRGDDDREIEMPEQTKKLVEENARKAKELKDE